MAQYHSQQSCFHFVFLSHGAVIVDGCELKSRYGVFRRSKNTPFFHPSFFDYGGDKMEFFHRLNMIGRKYYTIRMKTRLPVVCVSSGLWFQHSSQSECRLCSLQGELGGRADVQSVQFLHEVIHRMEDCECYVRCEEETVLWCLVVCFLFQSSHIAK